MNPDAIIARVKNMGKVELFELVMGSPWFLTDYYYHDIGAAIRERYEQLKTDFMQSYSF